jgi:hypothetical protein
LRMQQMTVDNSHIALLRSAAFVGTQGYKHVVPPERRILHVTTDTEP